MEIPAQISLSSKQLGLVLLQGLLQTIESSNARDIGIIETLLIENASGQKASVYEEIQYLRIYGIDFGTFTILGMTPLYDIVMGSFYDFLEQAEADGIVNSGTLQGYRKRQVAYMAGMRAATGASKDAVFVGIGGTFAWMCGLDENAAAASVGVMEFIGVQKFTQALIRSYKVNP